jgi:hypothetical protein
MAARQKSRNYLKRGVAKAFGREMKYTSATYYRPTACDYDGSIMQQTFNQVLPNELLSRVVESWQAYEAVRQAYEAVWQRGRRKQRQGANVPDIGLSNTYISALRYAALASATRCFWPPDKSTPLSPTTESKPLGKDNIKSKALANLAASLTSSSLALGLP